MGGGSPESPYNDSLEPTSFFSEKLEIFENSELKILGNFSEIGGIKLKIPWFGTGDEYYESCVFNLCSIFPIKQ